jgi:hypothetical protein
MKTRLGCVLAMFLAVSAVAFAQATATLNGRVADQGGAVVPGANVSVTNAGTGQVRSTVTNAEGLYSVPALNPGTYSVKVDHPGFANAVRDGVELLGGSTFSVDLQLGIAQQQQTVEVSGQAELIETTQAGLASSVRQAEVTELPMLNRSLSAMLNLVSGAREVAIPGQSSHGQGAMYVSFGGGAGRNTDMQVDGVDNKDEQDGGSGMNYSLEGIQEFRVMTSNFPAEYGKASVMIVLATKSGSNNLHGSGFVQGRNQAMTSTDYFSQPAHGGIGKLPFSRLQYGGSIGGPIIKDKAWYFGSAERVQQSFNLPRPDSLYQQLQILQTVNPSVLLTHSIPQDSRDLLIQGKVNYQFRANQTFFVKYAEQSGYVNNDAVTAGRALLATGALTDQNQLKVFTGTGGWTWVLSPTAVNQLSLLWEYYKHDNLYDYTKPIPGAPSGCLANPGVTRVPDACFNADTTFPDVSAGYAGAFRHFQNFQRKYEEKDDFSKQLGRHALKAGMDLAQLPLYGGNYGPGSPGNITFFADPSVIASNSNGLYPLGFKTPGIVRSITVTSGTPALYASLDAWNAGAYVQDDYKVTSRLTINVGLRYDINSMWNQPQWSQNRVYQALRAIGNKYAVLPHTDTTEWQPRLGFAWDIGGNGKNVFRGGAGIFWDQGLITSIFSPNLLSKPIIFYSSTTIDPAIGQGLLKNYVYGVSPLLQGVLAPTSLPVGQSLVGSFFAPNFKDAHTDQFHAGFSHAFSQSQVLAVDYTHIISLNGWRTLDINPLINGVRPLSALTQAAFGDPNLFGAVNMLASVDKSLYDEVAFHFERRHGRLSFQANYTLAWARGMGGSAERSTQNNVVQPQIPSVDGGQIYRPWEWGPAFFDERHRVVVAGIYTLPWGIEVSPSLTYASPRPYTQYRAPNPDGDGFLQLLCPANTSYYGQNVAGPDVGFGPGQVPCGVTNARGNNTFVLNARVTKAFTFRKEDRKLTVYGELYNITNRANFGNNYNPYAFSPATYNLPNTYIGGIGSVSTLPISFQVQVGGRFSF